MAHDGMALICTQIMYWPGYHFIIHDIKLRNAERGWTLITFLPSSTKWVNCLQQWWHNWIRRQQDKKYQAHSDCTSTTQFLQMVQLKTIQVKIGSIFYRAETQYISSKLISLYLKTCTQNTQQAQNVFLE